MVVICLRERISLHHDGNSLSQRREFRLPPPLPVLAITISFLAATFEM